MYNCYLSFFSFSDQYFYQNRIFMVTEFSQQLFDIGFSYEYCKVTPAH